MTPTVLYLCGAGNPDGVRLARAINRNAMRWGRLAILDDDPSLHGTIRLGVPVEGSIDLLCKAGPDACEALNLVARTTVRRRAVRDRIDAAGIRSASVIAADVDTEGVELEGDVLVYGGVTLGAEARLGAGACVLAGAVVGHEARVGAGAVIAPNAVINARVVVGEGAYIGANATVLPGLRIGAWSMVGAGSTVIADVPEQASVLGVPAEPLADPAATRLLPSLELRDAEHLVAVLWCDLLSLTAVDPLRSFFDLGGSSLLALRALQALRQQTGRDLGIVDLYRHPTVRSLAGYLASPTAVPTTAASRGLRRREVLLDAATRRVPGPAHRPTG